LRPWTTAAPSWYKVAVLCVVGDLVEDVVVRPTAAHRPDTDNPAVIRRRRGGSAANVAEAAAVAGGRVRFVGRIGDDPLGKRLVADLVAAGVDVRVQRAGHTGSIVVVVEPDEGRTMYPDRGAAAELGPIDGSWAEGVTWLHLPAYSLCAEPAAASTIAFADAVRGRGRCRLSVDVSSTAVVDAYGPGRFTELLARLAPDVVLATAAEAARLTRWLPCTLVVKDGPRPVAVHSPDGRVVDVAVAPVAGIVDPTGAGDAFAAGFLVATMGGAAPPAAATVGNALAARVLRVVGARLPAPE